MKKFTLCILKEANVLLKCVLYLVLFVCFSTTFAQTPNEKYQARADSALKAWGTESYFVIKGTVKNFKAKFFEFVVTDYIENTEHSVLVDKDGNFEQEFAVVNSQNIYLHLNDDVLVFTVSGGDTLRIDWDEQNFKQSFSIVSPDTKRNSLLQTQLELYHNFRQPFLALLRDLNQNKTTYSGSEKYELINNQYNQKIRTIVKSERKFPELEKMQFSAFEDLIVSEYFLYADILRSNNILEMPLVVKQDSSFKLPTREVVFNGQKRVNGRFALLHNKTAFKVSNERYLTNVPEYRSFFYNYIRFSNPVSVYSNLVGYRLEEIPSKTNVTEQFYYQAKANFSAAGAKLMEDWFITKRIIDGLRADEFDHVEKVYHRFLEECKTPFFKNALIKNYEAVKNLKPGLPAPSFILKDEQGKNISLADFRGKVIYIDFWGVYCGPCILELEEATPKLHSTFRDKDVVFLNICVDTNNEEWKKGIKKYNVKGINLIAEGWGKNPVCQNYNISGIPHYVIVNKDGTIADHNAPAPSEKFGTAAKNSIERALLK